MAANDAPDADGESERLPDAEHPLELLANTFPTVEPEKLNTIYSRLEDGGQATLFNVAQTLEKAADLGKVPPGDYTTRADEAIAERATEDDDSGLVSKDEIQRGLQAERAVREGGFAERARELARQGDVSELIEHHLTVHQSGTDALLNPDRNDIPDDVKEAAIITIGALTDVIDERAQAGDIEGLDEISRKAGRLEPEGVRKQVINRVQGAKSLVRNDGTEYEQAREYALSEDNTPREVEQRLSEIHNGQWDVTYAQAVQIAEDANDWMNEYQQAMDEQ